MTSRKECGILFASWELPDSARKGEITMAAMTAHVKLHNNGIEQMLYVNRQRRVFAYPERSKTEI